jgi:mRNA interferase HigB
MHVITRSRLRDFWIEHPPAKGPMSAWHTIVENAQFTDFASVRNTFNSADLVKGHVVFNVNSYRIVADVRYQWGKVFILEVMTHAEYELWTKRMRKGK